MPLKPQDKRPPVPLAISVPAATNDKLSELAKRLNDADMDYIINGILDDCLDDCFRTNPVQKRTVPTSAKDAKSHTSKTNKTEIRKEQAV